MTRMLGRKAASQSCPSVTGYDCKHPDSESALCLSRAMLLGWALGTTFCVDQIQDSGLLEKGPDYYHHIASSV
eukprot:CAMPEP_0174383482 /NCGR_PEP_ID=MMETSP0811_2-20130205/125265_1 /TAXON_ID=73025 ORGANISM="Eutreptiella gymnastica-like, Strain CCMP1594" /NCGR_SAMPLE_ID=MMETSP0811_2 /ASSEMBLY_ACC=CAM_ASM_000667 /LENGTH=72 /DNA_ID=CAMNT_0015537085 /DNA_START=1158 /DNA_END=1375 /DNA_ORIENTATION=+